MTQFICMIQKSIFFFKYNTTGGNVCLSNVLKRLHALVSDYQLSHRNHGCTLGFPVGGHVCNLGLPIKCLDTDEYL